MAFTNTKESGLESLIVKWLVEQNGYEEGTNADYNKEYAVDETRLFRFLQDTQPKEMDKLGVFTSDTKKRQFLNRLSGEIAKRGIIDVLRNGVKVYPADLIMFYLTPTENNEQARIMYEKNIFSVTRQLRYSQDAGKLALDVCLFINGLPVITMELKNQLTKQNTENAVRQYKEDRDFHDLLFSFKRCMVHFAVDDATIQFCTKLAGKDSWFLPFNKGYNDGAGNPPNPDGLMTDYQQLVGDDDQEHFSELFTPDFFDLIIVDECHRGSAKEESRWRRILEYFQSATQIGMTATPKETKYISNLSYFGEPIYTYSLKEGIEDGFLAPFKVINIMTDIGEGWRPRKGQKDINGAEIPDRVYTNSDYDYNIIIEDRIQQVAQEITNYLKSTDRMAKTIVFCATEDAALRMRDALAKLNADMMKKNPDYVVRITGGDDYGKSKLKYFISVSSPYPVIATTSKLLSTGADCKMTKLIVLDEMIGSMTEFKQIIGRGTRLRENEGKTHFVVMDFRNVTRLFADPEWDGPIEMNEGYTPGKKQPKEPAEPTEPTPPAEQPTEPKQKPIVDKNGCKVQIIHKTVSVYDTNGKLLRQESIVDYTKENILGEYASLDNFIRKWSAQEKKEQIRDLLHERGIDLELLKSDQNMTDVDDFDFICHVAFDKKPLTRKERANNVKKRDFFSKYSGVAREVLEALLDKYMNTGIYEIEKTEILKLDPFLKLGKPAKIAGYFGGRQGYLKAVQELEQAIYTDEVV